MQKDSGLKKTLKIREHNIALIEEYIDLINMLGGQDEAIIRAMFLGFAAESIEASRVTYYFYDQENMTLFSNVIMVYKNKKLVPYDFYSDLKELSIKVGDDVCGLAVETKKPLFIKNTTNDDRYKGYVDKSIKMSANSIIAIPLIIDDKIIGVIEVANAKKSRHLTQIDFYVVSIITRITLITMEKTKLYD